MKRVIPLLLLALSLSLPGEDVIHARTAPQQQEIVIEAKNEPLASVLEKLENASGLKMQYVSSDVYGLKVDKSIHAAKINDALDQILQGTGLTYVIDKQYVTIKKGNAVPQQNLKANAVNSKLVSGVVVDNKGIPLQGATVRIKNTGLGTTTDAEGHFHFYTEQSKLTVEVSYLGFNSVVRTLNAGRNIKITLEEDHQSIDEVVVTGLMDRDAKNFTGNSSVYKGEELKALGHDNLLKSLSLIDPSINLVENTEAGSDPNTMPKIRFRGESSFQGFESIDKSGLVSDPNQPLFILDGYETTLERIVDLDMNRVESVTVLKDAAAGAIYGARAANGVIVVKTKKPKEGKLRVSYSFDLNAEFPDLSSYNLLNAKENMQLIDRLGLYRNDDGTLRPEYNQIAKWIAQGVNTDWLSQPLRNSYGTRHSLDLQGGDSRMRYGLDLNYSNIPGVMKKSLRDNYGISVDLSYNLNDRVLFSNTLSVNKTKAKESPYGSFSSYTTINSYFPIYDEDGKLYKNYYYTDENGNKSNVWGNVSNIPVNPLYEANVGNKNESDQTLVTNNFAFDWRITDDFRFNGRIAYSQTKTDAESFLSPNSATYTDYGTGMSDLTTEQQMLRGKYTHNETTLTSLEGNAFLTWSKQMGKHFATVSAGGSLSDSKSVVYGFTAQGFGSNDIGEPAYANGYEKGGVPANSEGHARLASFFASANYSYNDRYLFDFSYRLDGSSSFGNDKKSAPFYSTGIGWNAHNEQFIKKLKFINMLRLRITYGEVGSVNFAPYQAKNIYNFTTTSRYDGNIGVILQGFGNDKLKWQTTKSTEYGLTLGLWNRIDVTASVYRRSTTDMVLPVTTPPSMGFTSITENLGGMDNNGWELNFRGFVIKKPNFNVSLFLTASHNSNKIKSISSALESFNNRGSNRSDYQSENDYIKASHTFLTRYEEGQSSTAIYAVRSLGIDPMTGQEIFLTKKGHPTLTWDANDEVVVGDTNPDARGTFGTNVGWKGLYLNLTFSYQFGGQVYNQTLVDKVENSNKYKNVDKRVLTETWQKPGDEARYKANVTSRLVQYYTYASSRFVQDYDLLQLASLSLQYELPKSWVKPLYLESVRLSFNTSDLGYWSTVKRERGTSYPYSRTFVFGLRVDF